MPRRDIDKQVLYLPCADGFEVFANRVYVPAPGEGCAGFNNVPCVPNEVTQGGAGCRVALLDLRSSPFFSHDGCANLH